MEFAAEGETAIDVIARVVSLIMDNAEEATFLYIFWEGRRGYITNPSETS